MNTGITRKNLSILALALAVMLAAAGSTAKAQSAAPLQPFTYVAPAGAAPGEPFGVTHTLTLVRSEPQAAAEVVDVLPGLYSVKILSRSADGAWIAVASRRDASQVSGYIPAGAVDLSADFTVLHPAQATATTLTLTLVRSEPGEASSILDVLPGNYTVVVLERSAAGDWLAIASRQNANQVGGWIPAGAVDQSSNP